MSRSYLPETDQTLDTFGLNFSTLLTANPLTYGLSAPEALAVQNAYNAYHAAFLAATNPATRTHGTIQTKNNAKKALVAAIRPVAMFIRDNTTVSDALKLGLGLHIPDRTPTPVPAPTTSPILAIINATPGQQMLRFSDSAAPDKRAKPAGVIGLQLFRKVAAAGPVSPADMEFIGMMTKQPLVVEFTPDQFGKIAFYAGRWQTRTGLVGPSSQVVNMTVAG